jgi:hypothetical protein
MKCQLIQTKDFEDTIEKLIAKRTLKKEDFENFKRSLVENPEQGDMISGTGGIRKVRLKSASKGKSGGFRVCYLYIENRLILFLLFIYAKNEQENLSQSEKAELKQLVDSIKRSIKNE